jgi:L-amino acid N-acyltransferase YncA
MLTIRPMAEADAEAVLKIYQVGIDAGNATFETAAPTWPDFDARRLPAHRLVATDETGTVRGWVTVSAFSSRPFYRGVVEHSVYVDPAVGGRGIGTALLRALISSTEAAGIWTIHSRIFPENTASLALHAKVGFDVVGVRRRLGCHHGRWRDVVMVERRSLVVGVE